VDVSKSPHGDNPQKASFPLAAAQNEADAQETPFRDNAQDWPPAPDGQEVVGPETDFQAG
jgi:hypothetical protein